jgi:uncharacterized protein DUF5677
MTDPEIMPKAPNFSAEELERCNRTGDYNPILFEWYKFVGSLNAIVAHIQRDSPAFKPVQARHYHILSGLVNRCARLMLANVELSHKGLFGETTAIVDRCIFESAMKIVWLCQRLEDERFVRYLADGLMTEIEFKAQIESNVVARSGEILPIERRMLASIANHIASSGLSESEVISAKRLPDMASMLAAIGYDRLMYVVAHRIGSHHIHGTWSSLLIHYLEEEVGKPEFSFRPRGHDCETNFNQFAFVPLMVLQALSAYVQFAFEEPEGRAFVELFESTELELMRLYEEAGAADDRRRDSNRTEFSD